MASCCSTTRSRTSSATCFSTTTRAITRCSSPKSIGPSRSTADRCSTTAAGTRSWSDDHSVLTPSRRRGVEILDDPATDSAVRERSIGDVTRSNRWLGGLRAAVLEARAVLPRLGASATLLDVGTGLADIPRQLSAEASATGRSLTTIGIDGVPSLVAAARRHVSYAVCARRARAALRRSQRGRRALLPASSPFRRPPTPKRSFEN